MCNPLKYLFIILSTVLSLSCSQNESYAGGTWDEAGNTLSLMIKDQDGLPVKNARINVVHLNEWQDKFSESKDLVSESFTTDTAGNLTLKLNGVPARIEVEKSLSTSYLVGGVLIKDSLENLSIVIKESQKIQGVLKDYDPALKSSLALIGTSQIALVDSIGRFSFDKVGEGDWTIAIKNQSQIHYFDKSISIKETSIELDTIEWIENNEILIEDFSDEIQATRYYYQTGKSWWFCSSDSISEFYPKDLMKAQEVLVDLEEFGNVFHMEFQIDETTPGKFALCGFDINESRIDNPIMAQNDLSALDSISFWAKGTGPISLNLISVYANHTDSSNQFIIEVPIDNEWKRHVVSIEQYSDLYGSEVIEKMLTEMTTIGFAQTQSVEFWIDQIILHGPKPSEIFKP